MTCARVCSSLSSAGYGSLCLAWSCARLKNSLSLAQLLLRVSGVEGSCASLFLDLGLLLEVSCYDALALGLAFALIMITHLVRVCMMWKSYLSLMHNFLVCLVERKWR